MSDEQILDETEPKPKRTRSKPAAKAIEEVARQVADIRHADPVSVHEAIAIVMRRLPAIGKDGTAPPNMGGYKFRGIEQITSVLQPILASVGLVIVPQAQSIVIDPSPGQKEAWQDVLVKFDWLIVGPDGSSLSASTYGIGRDHTDKGANKAASQAYKYLLMQLFCIADSKDDTEAWDYSDAAADAPRAKTVDERETDELLDRLTALGEPEREAVKAWAHSLDRTLAPSAMVADPDWRKQITGLVDEIEAEVSA
jgi:hypothetical protein